MSISFFTDLDECLKDKLDAYSCLARVDDNLAAFQHPPGSLTLLWRAIVSVLEHSSMEHLLRFHSLQLPGVLGILTKSVIPPAVLVSVPTSHVLRAVIGFFQHPSTPLLPP